MTDLKINPEFQSLIPAISEDEYKLLEESIIKEGCREKIVVWNEFILDGHTRYEICRRHDIRFGINERSFESQNEAKIWIIRNQLARRNLPLAERTRLILLLKPAIEEKAKARQRGGQAGVLLPQKSAEAKSIDTREELAKLAGVSHDTVHKVEVIEKKATPEVKEAVHKGKISVNKAYKMTRPKVAREPPKRLKAKKNEPEALFQLKKWWTVASLSSQRRFIGWLKKGGHI